MDNKNQAEHIRWSTKEEERKALLWINSDSSPKKSRLRGTIKRLCLLEYFTLKSFNRHEEDGNDFCHTEINILVPLGNMIIIYSNVTHKTGPCPQAPVTDDSANKEKRPLPSRHPCGWHSCHLNSLITSGFMNPEWTHISSLPWRTPGGASQAFIWGLYRPIETWQGHLAALTEQADKMLKCSKQKVQQTTKQCGHFMHISSPHPGMRGDLIPPTGRSVLRIWLR